MRVGPLGLVCAVLLAFPACRDDLGSPYAAVHANVGDAAAAADFRTRPAPGYAHASAQAVEDLEVAFKASIARVSPAVVSVYSTKTIDPRSFDAPWFLFSPPLPLEQRGLGSGVIFDGEGHVLTNAHVIAGADEIRVELSDGTETDAKVIGIDAHSDIAVLEVDEKGVVPGEFGDSDAMEVGDWVLAIGSRLRRAACGSATSCCRSTAAGSTTPEILAAVVSLRGDSAP